MSARHEQGLRKNNRAENSHRVALTRSLPKATVCFTAPTAYRAMLAAMDEGADLSPLRVAVSAGETLPAPVYEAWTKRTGVPILDGVGSTKMLHVFIANRLDDRRPGVTGTPVPGYEATIHQRVGRPDVGRRASSSRYLCPG